MKLARLLYLSLATALIAVSAPIWAAQHDPHKGHHPAASVAAATAISMPAKTTPETAQMANQMKAMQEMHNKMMAAKTPEQRDALMADHLQAVQDGMGMMKGKGGRGEMSNSKASPADMVLRQARMEQRMDMMRTMMEMMADRLPQTPTKP